ncbi:hypothetical protein [Ideonella sp. BN130291]|uniref:hypothetical protein n=1 Tax=Ideonella sp. BN130291 TaxID=3112940 RepID=UPI002E26BCB6|nr:hypothetical protein [Ideonella sp. BN130291]
MSLVVCSAAASAEPVAGGDFRRNGGVSHRLYVPSATDGIAGPSVSAGLALGLRGVVRQQLGRRLAPTLTMGVNDSTSVSLLAAPGKGAMVVLQSTGW